MFFIVLTTLLFISWAFLSFFVHILVAIFFPVVSGAVLGLWIYSWRNVREHFIVCGQIQDNLDLAKASRVHQQYRKLPPASQSPTINNEMRPNYHGHHQVPVWINKPFKMQKMKNKLWWEEDYWSISYFCRLSGIFRSCDEESISHYYCTIFCVVSQMTYYAIND